MMLQLAGSAAISCSRPRSRPIWRQLDSHHLGSFASSPNMVARKATSGVRRFVTVAGKQEDDFNYLRESACDAIVNFSLECGNLEDMIAELETPSELYEPWTWAQKPELPDEGKNSTESDQALRRALFESAEATKRELQEFDRRLRSKRGSK